MTLEIRNKLPDDHPIKRGLVAFVPKRTTDPSANPMQAVADAYEADVLRLATAGQLIAIEKVKASK